MRDASIHAARVIPDEKLVMSRLSPLSRLPG
jgi:hypothetical protein